MDRDQVMNAVTRHMRLNADGLDGVVIDPSQSMQEFGLSSLDTVEVVSASMRELKIRVPRTELVKLSNIDELVDLFVRARDGR